MPRELDAFEERFLGAGMGPIAWELFSRMYEAYRRGAPPVDWALLAPPSAGDVPRLEDLERAGLGVAGQARMGQLAWIVLNGGLGTSMRMDRAKSLLPVKDGKTFLELIVVHALSLRRPPAVRLPLLFMNSFATRADTLKALAPYSLAAPGAGGAALPIDFEQHRFPRIRAQDGLPYGAPDDPEAWAPPGHGDLFAALADSGTLDALLAAGIRWAFVSNADNLGASPAPAILERMARESLEFLVEVTPRTAADVKGGALVRLDGRLTLLEIAQVPADRLEDFQNVRLFPAFNTNNLWMDLGAVARRMASGGLELPTIVNRKTVAGTPVVQLESAMGSAVGAFARTGGVEVPRSRFAPVKTLEDLLVRRSDVYLPGKRSPLELSPRRDPRLGPPVVRLDPRYFGTTADFDLRIPRPPSLVEATALTVTGDVRFGGGVTVRGRAVVVQKGASPLFIPDGAALGEGP